MMNEDGISWLCFICALYHLKGIQAQCAIPFMYEGNMYQKCVNINSKSYWCSLDAVYAQQRWSPCCSLPVIANGAISADPSECTQETNTNCQFTCETDYIFKNGKDTAHCNSEQKWDSPMVECIIKTCDVYPTLADGLTLVDCTADKDIGSVCSYQCTAPRQVTPLTVLKSTCAYSSDNKLQFRPLTMNPCHRLECRPLAMLANVDRFDCSDGTNLHSVCSVVCTPGFYSTHRHKSSCVEDDRDGEHFYRWDAQLAACDERKSCCTPLDLPYSTLTCTDGLRYASECTYTCNDGYTKDVNNKIICDDKLQWQPVIRMPCKRKNCGDPPAAPTNTIILYCSSPEKLLFSKCVYECMPGYVPQAGAITVSKCEANGATLMLWHPLPSPCTAPTCDISNITGIYAKLDVCSDNQQIGSVCEYKCDAGYELPANGVQETTCVWDETTSAPGWDAIITACVAKRCAMSAQVNGHEGDCTDRERPLWAKCRFDCDAGYQLVGGNRSIIECVLDGSDVKWDAQPGDCQPKSCEPPRVPAFALKTDCDVILGGACNFLCEPGYEFAANAITRIECQLTGDGDLQWDKTPGTCTRQICDPAATQANGFEDYCAHNTRYFGVFCYFTCNDGYLLPPSGVAYVKCEASGNTSASGVHWSDTLTECTKKSCQPMYQPFGHESPNCTNELDTTCSFDCDAGYTLPANGKKTARCTFDKGMGMVWDEETTACIPQTCLEATQTNGHEFVCTVTTRAYLSTCYFACDDGFYIPEGGNARVDCVLADETLTSGVTWNGTLTPCEERLCYSASQQFGDEVTKCDNKFNSVCEFRCKDGFELPAGGINKATCTYDKTRGIMTWGNKLTACEPRQCSAPEAAGTHNLQCDDGHLFMSLCDFQCDPGHVLDGKKFQRIRCEAENGTMLWKPALVPCEKRTCVNLTQLNGHFTTCSSPDGQFLFKDKCDTACDTGYTLPPGGRNSSTCVADEYPGLAIMRWDNPPTACIRRNCTLQLERGISMDICSDHQRYESECIFTCESGFALASGHSSSKCVVNTMGAMIWEPAQPICERRSCGGLTLVNSREVNCTDGYQFETTCLIECTSGHQFPIDGTPVFDRSTCMVNGTDGMAWNISLTACEVMKCPPITQSNGELRECTNSQYVDNTTCDFQCLPGYKLPNGGNSSTTCTLATAEDGVEWVGELTPCQAEQCPEWNKTHVVIIKCTSGSDYLSTCQTSCVAGYGFDGDHDHTINCSVRQHENGTDMFWTESPQCKVLNCSQPWLDNGVELSCGNGYQYGSSCSFKCLDGYKFGDDSTIGIVSCDKLLPNAVDWDLKLICEARRCNPMVVPNSYIVKCTDGFQYASVCTLMCKAGYRFEEGYDDVMECASNELGDTELHWNDTSKCTEMNCTQPVFPDGTTLSCTDGERLGSMCDISCQPGDTPAVEGPVSCQPTCDPRFPSTAGEPCVFGPIVDKHIPLDWNDSIATICQDIDECASSPCMNDGTCVNANQMYVCECTDTTTGLNCETDLETDESNDGLGGFKDIIVNTAIAASVVVTAGAIGAAVWLATSNSALAKSVLAKIIALFKLT